MDTLRELNAVFADVFRNPGLILTEETDASSLDGWDSFTHMEIIAAVESRFGINFSFNEVMSFRNAGEIVRCIDGHLKK